jgi:TIGR03009 family protein
MNRLDQTLLGIVVVVLMGDTAFCQQAASSGGRGAGNSERPRAQAAGGVVRGDRGAAPRLVATRPLVQAPPGFALTAEQQAHVDQILGYWERRTSNVKTFSCDFTRFEYDPVFGPKDPQVYKTYSRGEIRYAAPDKGMIRIDEIRHYVPPRHPGEKPQYEKQEGEVGEHWVCDGQSIFEFDHRKKQLIETALPPEMQGQAISNGPLPFLFGAKAATLQERYWVRENPAQEAKPRYYQLEAVPKRREDAGSFRSVQVFLDVEKFLPVGMVVWDLNGQGRWSYKFENRKENDVLHRLGNWMNGFIRPKAPQGWDKVPQDLGQPEETVGVRPEVGEAPANPRRR